MIVNGQPVKAHTDKRLAVMNWGSMIEGLNSR